MGKARGAAPRGREGWPRARARRDRGRLGRPPSATCRRDRARPRGERAGKRPRWAGRRGAGWSLQQARALPDRDQSAPSALGAGPGLRRAPRADASCRSSAGARPPPDGPSPRPPAPSPPLRCTAPAALLGLQKTWAPPSNHSPSQSLASAGSPRAAPTEPGLRLMDSTYLPRRRSEQGGEISAATAGVRRAPRSARL